MEQFWRKKFSTWLAPPRRNSKLSPRLNTPFAKLAVSLSARQSLSAYFAPDGCRETHDSSASGTRLRVNDRALIVGRLCQTPDCLGVSQKRPTNIGLR